MTHLFVSLLVTLLLVTSDAGSLKRAPDAPELSVSGVPFEEHITLGMSPSSEEDQKDKELEVTRLTRTDGAQKDTVPAHACDLGEQADQKKCMNVKGRGCMWTRVESRNPLLRIQESNAYCLPCRLDGNAMPCWNIGAWVDGKQVTHCQMNCVHQKIIQQPEYVCSDETGAIGQAQCFSRGTETGSKCMFMAYETAEGEQKGSCGPCALSGSGGWGCPSVGGDGPVAGSKVKSCLSQCDVICSGPPACPPTVAPPPPPPLPAPGIAASSSPEDVMLSAPGPGFAVPTVNPFAIMAAARMAAEKAGFRAATTLHPSGTYWPVVYYRAPGDFMYTTGPPPETDPEPPVAASSAAASLLQSTKRTAHVEQVPTALRRLRHRTSPL